MIVMVIFEKHGFFTTLLILIAIIILRFKTRVR
jgi:hypothetical protein